MISVTEARNLIKINSGILEPKSMAIELSAGLILAEDIFAKTDIPSFPQSSMDGYAISFSGWKEFHRLNISGMMAAGSQEKFILSPDQAIRIFTGAAVPEGADTVVMQEKTRVIDGQLFIDDQFLVMGTNLRPMGAEINSGALALPKGTKLSPAAIGFLSGIGIAHVLVYPRPTISIIVTGNELQQPGYPIEYGQVYESNSYTLRAVLENLQIRNINVHRAIDSLDILTTVLNTAINESDMVLITGGISVGDFDFVLSATENCNVEKIFHKVRQKPGKPFYFGKKDQKLIFGLPGNPSSVLTCFYEYVMHSLHEMTLCDATLKSVFAPISRKIIKPSGLTQFLKGHYDAESVSPLDAQESFRLSSFAKANCLIVLSEEKTEYAKGEIVEVHLLPV
jgi:molybdopterin molybdotransferase